MLPNYIHIISGNGFTGGNCYLFIDKHLTMVDTGAPGCRQNIERVLSSFRREQRELSLVINTHLHPDHIGNNAYCYSHSPNLRILVHANGSSIVRNGERREWYRNFLDVDQGFPVHQELRDGDVVTLGKHALSVIHTPGHSPDSICLFESGNRILFSGDTLLNGDIGVVNARRDYWGNLAQMEKGIKRVQKLGVRWILPGHGGIVSDPESLYRIAFKKIEKMKRNPVHVIKHFIDKCLLPVCLSQESVDRDTLISHFCNSDWYRCFESELGKAKMVNCLDSYLESLVDFGLLEQPESGVYSCSPLIR